MISPDVSDVRAIVKKRGPLGRFVSFFGVSTINLRPKFRERHPWVVAFVAIVLFTIFGFGLRRLFVRAEVGDFYPASCLGTWQSPEKAQGKPESLSGAPIDATSSALSGGTAAQIFCGSFIPQGTDETGEIKSVGLTLVWDMAGLPASVATPVATSTIEASTTDPSAFLFFFPSAHAQTVPDSDASVGTDTTPAPVAAPAPAADDSSTVILGPPLSATLTPIDENATGTASDTTGTSASSATSSLPAPAAPIPPSPLAPDDNFLLISYSTDGNTWIALQKVNADNWKNLTVSLPISRWSDLEKLQIKIEAIPTALAVMPQVFLDGMLVEAHYDVPPVFIMQDGASISNATSASQIIQVSPGVTIETPPQGPIPFVPAPTIVDLIKSSTTVSVTIQYIGDFYEGNPLYLYMYPQGTTAERNGSDAAYAFAQQPAGGPSVNPLPVGEGMLDPTTKQATIVLITDAPDGDQVPLDAMTPGTYAVDLSYFDSAQWHLIPPTTFEWP